MPSLQQRGEMDKRLLCHLFLCPDAPWGAGEQVSTLLWRLQEEVTVINPKQVIPSGGQWLEVEILAGKQKKFFDPHAVPGSVCEATCHVQVIIYDTDRSGASP